MENINTKTTSLDFSPDINGLRALLDYLKEKVFHDPSLSLSLIDQGLKIAQRYTDPTYRLDLLQYLGAIHLQKGLYPHALEHFNEALDLASEIKNGVAISRIYNNIGLIYKAQEKYAEALEIYYKCLKFSESKQNPYIYSNIGSILYIQEDWDKALQYYTNALFLAEKHNDVPILCVCCINIGDFYKARGDYPKAISYLEKGLAIAEEHEEVVLHEGMSLQQLGSIFGLMSSFDEAMNYFNEANAIYRENELIVNLTRSLTSQANLLIARSQINEANDILSEVITLCDGHNFSAEKIAALKLLIKCADANKDMKASNLFLRQLADLQHDHYTKEKDLQVAAVADNMHNEVEILLQKNEEIERQNMLLESSNNELKQYAYIIAHDLKEPMRNINSFTNLLSRHNADSFSDECKEFMKIVEQNATKMNSKLDDLLSYVSIKLDKSKLALLDTENVIYKVLNVLQRELQDSKIILDIGLLHNLYMVPNQMSLLFYHLIKNAIQCQDMNKDFHTIKISSILKDGLIEYCIHDNGVGVQKRNLEKVFHIFKQMEVNNKRPDGTGIGLAMCSKIVRLYDGSMRIESTLGVETKVFFTIKAQNV